MNIKDARAGSPIYTKLYVGLLADLMHRWFCHGLLLVVERPWLDGGLITSDSHRSDLSSNERIFGT